MFLDVLKNMLAFAMLFEQKHGFRFIETLTKNRKGNPKAFDFLSGARFTTCKQQIHAAKTMLRCPASLKYVQDEA